MRFFPAGKISLNYFLCFAAIVLTSLIVCIFTWQDLHIESLKVQSGVYEVYRVTGEFIRQDGLLSVFDPQARVASPDYVSHPPGYPLLIWLILSFTNEPKNALQFISLLAVIGNAVLIFLIAEKIFSFRTAFITGILAALAPQFASNAIPLLPDVLSVFPILLGLYFFVGAYRQPRLLSIILSGICLGLACWLRSNYLLLPFFFIPAICLLFERNAVWKYSLALIFSFILTITPITIRNAVVYGAFIPVSIGAGQTLLEGIGDYDPEQKLGIPSTDAGIIEMEARQNNQSEVSLTDQPECRTSLFGSEGIKRDRARIKLGLRVIRENPLWFMGVMMRRASSMLRLERSTIVSPDITVIATGEDDSSIPQQSISGVEISRKGQLIAPNATVNEAEEPQAMILQTNSSKYDAQFATALFPARKNHSYSIRLHLKLVKGRISLKIVGTESGQVYFSRTLTRDNFCLPPAGVVEKLSFVPQRDEPVRLIISNEVIEPPGSILEISRLNLYESGEAAHTWTRPLRFIIHNIQKIFKTAVILPLAIFGLIILIRRKKREALIILAVIPVYFFCVRSILHTEYRYILTIYYILFTFAAIFVDWFGTTAFEKFKRYFSKESNKTTGSL